MRTIWWDKDEPAGYRPEGWIEIHPEMRCPPGAPVAASWANEDHLDIFVTDRFGVVQSTFWDANEPGFRADGWFAIGPAAFLPGGHVTANRTSTRTTWTCSRRTAMAWCARSGGTAMRATAPKAGS